MQNIRTVIETGKSFYPEHINPDGKSIGTSVTLHDSEIVITALDITVLKDAENQQALWMQEIVDSNVMLQSIDSMKDYIKKRGEFLRSTSHDLPGSFGVIMGATALLDVVDTDEDRARTLSMLQRNLRQVASMMNQLLDFSRLESGQEIIETVLFDAAEMLTSLCASTMPMAVDKGLWLRFDGPSNLPVVGDAVKIHRIAQNLIINSIKYVKQGGVVVSWGRDCESDNDASHWHFTVSDTGEGIPPDLIQKLIDSKSDANFILKSQDSDNMVPEITAGEGIGLFIVKRLCDLIQARLEITSSAENGTVFRIISSLSY